MLKAIIFDFDGVLVESVDIKTKSFAKLFEKEGKAVVKKVIDYHLSNSGISRFVKIKHIYKNILNRRLRKAEFNRLCRRFSELVIDEVVNAPYVRGAEQFLKEHSLRYKLFVVSATPDKEIKDIIRRRKISKLFRGVYGSPEEKTEIVRRIVRSNNLSPRDAVYVGDALSDYKAASVNSLDFIARVTDNKNIFEGISCPRVKDLIGLTKLLGIKNKIK